MPDLNLQDDEGSLDNLDSAGGEELTVSEDEGAPKKKSSALTVVIVILVVVILGAGGVYVLNRLGVVKLWGTRAAPEVVQMEEQMPAQTETMAQDTAEVTMVETPPLTETRQPSTRTAVKPSQPARQMPAATAGPSLGEMKGEYTVQVSAWRDKEKAQEMVKRLEEAGYPAFVEERSFQDDAWYTVRIGRYASLMDAQSAVVNFAEELRSSYWIDRIRTR